MTLWKSLATILGVFLLAAFFIIPDEKAESQKKQIDVRQFTQKSINKDSFSQDQATLDNLILADSVAPRSGHNFTVYSDAQRTKPAMILDRETGKTYVESYSAENFDFGPNPRIEIKEMVVKKKIDTTEHKFKVTKIFEAKMVEDCNKTCRAKKGYFYGCRSSNLLIEDHEYCTDIGRFTQCLCIEEGKYYGQL